MSTKPETLLQRNIVKALKKQWGNHIWILKTFGSAYQKRGVPDLLVSLLGHFMAIEVKMPGNQPTENQRATMWEMSQAGIRTFWVTSVDEAVAQCNLYVAYLKDRDRL